MKTFQCNQSQKQMRTTTTAINNNNKSKKKMNSIQPACHHVLRWGKQCWLTAKHFLYGISTWTNKQLHIFDIRKQRKYLAFARKIRKKPLEKYEILCDSKMFEKYEILSKCAFWIFWAKKCQKFILKESLFS